VTGRVTALAAALVVSVGCTGDLDPTSAAAVEARVDTALVAALADLHLADARASLTADSLRRPSVADSLKGVALRTHHLDADALASRLDALADDPALARATYNAVETRLGDGRQRLTF
jgi:hypothetical protein